MERIMDNVNTRVTLKRIISEFKLEIAYMPEGAEDINVISMEINRPGLRLAGFFEEFDKNRVQIIGSAEALYIEEMDDETMRGRLAEFFSRHPVAVVYSHGNKPTAAAVELAEYFSVPLFYTGANTSEFMAALISFLNVQLAPQITRHGVFVEVYGEGVLILGDSGVGKSETAIELVKRGHRLVADDAVEIKRVSAISLVGTSPKVIRHFIELRGIGIVDVRRIFGMGAVKDSEKIDLIVNLEAWNTEKQYDRLGLVDEKTEILGIEVNSITIPVKPGRNLAVILEVAAMNNRQKRMGYNAAETLNRRLMGDFNE